MKFLSVLIKVLRLPLLLILVILAIIFLNSLNNARNINYFDFTAGLNKKINHGIDLVNAAKQAPRETFDTPVPLRPTHSWFYRFDENLENANVVSIDKSVFKPSSDTVFSFSDPDALEMKPTGNKFTIKNGALAYRHSLNNLLTNDSVLSLSRDLIGDIELRIKVARSDELQLCWSALPDAAFDDFKKIEQMKISVIPDGQFHIYRVPELVMASWLHGRDRTIRKLYLLPMDPEMKDNIEIDYIRFAPRDEKFAGSAFGSDYEKVNAEMRKIFYLHSGYELKFRLEIPKVQSLFFRCGLAALDATRVSVSASVQGQEGLEMIFSSNIEGRNGWRDLKVDLSRFAGQDATIIFKTEADATNVVFFSTPILYSPPEEKSNIIMVIEDALRADHMSCYGNQRKTTPFKDNWRQEGILFRNAFSQSSFTRSSCASFLTSLYPSATGVWNNADRLSDNYMTLSEILYQHGVATALFSQNTNVGPFSGLHQGFGTVIDNEIIGERAPGIYDSDVLKNWIADHSDQNIFIFLHVLDPHYPFTPPPEVSAPYRDKGFLFGKLMIPHNKLYDPPWLKRVSFESRNFLYDEEIRYNDIYFPALINLLKEQEIYDETLLIFTSDHGEHMGEHYLWNHQPPNYQRVLHVPLIMVYPDCFPSGVEINQPVQLLDIMPTFLDVAGINPNTFLIQGDSLLPYIRQQKPWSDWEHRLCLADEVRFSKTADSIANGGIFYKNFHIMSSDRHTDMLSHWFMQKDERWFNLFSRTQIFDVNKDPDETASLVNFLPDWFLTHRIQRFQNDFRRINLELHETIAGGSQKTVVYDNKTIDQLKSLGYIK